MLCRRLLLAVVRVRTGLARWVWIICCDMRAVRSNFTTHSITLEACQTKNGKMHSWKYSIAYTINFKGSVYSSYPYILKHLPPIGAPCHSTPTRASRHRGSQAFLVFLCRPSSSFFLVLLRIEFIVCKLMPGKETVLSDAGQNGLLLAIVESNDTLDFSEFCNSRVELYGTRGSKLRKAARNRYDWTKKLKIKDPGEYW
jgi:hypothetical protein